MVHTFVPKKSRNRAKSQCQTHYTVFLCGKNRAVLRGGGVKLLCRLQSFIFGNLFITKMRFQSNPNIFLNAFFLTPLYSEEEVRKGVSLSSDVQRQRDAVPVYASMAFEGGRLCGLPVRLLSRECFFCRDAPIFLRPISVNYYLFFQLLKTVYL